VHAAALAMDRRAYRTTKGLYRPTPPAQSA
jgi:hypothetical protein